MQCQGLENQKEMREGMVLKLRNFAIRGIILKIPSIAYFFRDRQLEIISLLLDGENADDKRHFQTSIYSVTLHEYRYLALHSIGVSSSRLWALIIIILAQINPCLLSFYIPDIFPVLIFSVIFSTPLGFVSFLSNLLDHFHLGQLILGPSTSTWIFLSSSFFVVAIPLSLLSYFIPPLSICAPTI